MEICYENIYWLVGLLFLCKQNNIIEMQRRLPGTYLVKVIPYLLVLAPFQHIKYDFAGQQSYATLIFWLQSNLPLLFVIVDVVHK